MAGLTSDQRRMAILVGILVVVGLWAAVNFWNRRSDATGTIRGEQLEWSPHDLPELLEPVLGESAEPVEEARNPFVFGQPPTPTPNLTPQPTPEPRPTQPPRIRPTATPAPPGWRPTPVFEREYIGSFGPVYKRVAVFRQATGEGFAEIAVAPIGGMLPNARGEDTFIVRAIDLESVVIGYVGFPEKEKTRVPLSQR